MTESVYGPSWYAATMMAAPERDRLVYELDVDVCVIGGGLAGLTTARELARRGWSAAVLEANRVAWDASGRNAGIVAPGFAETPERIIERVGFERTRALWILSAGGVDYVRSTIRETAMAGVSPVDGWLTVQRIDHADRARARGAEEQVLLPGPASAQRVPHPSAQLCPRPGRRGGRGGGKNLREHACARDRSGRRAQARHHPVRPRARRPRGIRRQRPPEPADAAGRRLRPAGHQLYRHHGAA